MLFDTYKQAQDYITFIKKFCYCKNVKDRTNNSLNVFLKFTLCLSKSDVLLY